MPKKIRHWIGLVWKKCPVSRHPTPLGASINEVGNWEGGVKIGQNGRRIVLKTANIGEEVSKIRRNCQRRLWMVL